MHVKSNIQQPFVYLKYNFFVFQILLEISLQNCKIAKKPNCSGLLVSS